MTNRSYFVLGDLAFPGNPYNGHTLSNQLGQVGGLLEPSRKKYSWTVAIAVTALLIRRFSFLVKSVE